VFAPFSDADNCPISRYAGRTDLKEYDEKRAVLMGYLHHECTKRCTSQYRVEIFDSNLENGENEPSMKIGRIGGAVDRAYFW
jgi:hypothetical protein